MSLDQIKSYLYNKGISANYNEPMSEAQVNRLNEKQARIIYNNIVATNNLVNIQQVKGEDLDIEETDKYCYILTYSFPCQDLSLAGKGKGMSDTSTRSGMLWEVERILTECHELGNLPQVLLMENVPQVHSQDNIADFHKWQLRLEELGYKNYMQDLIATDYGIPQTRNRCFMVSILGDYSYSFPQPIPLKLKLKDMLEDEVDEKYYLSDKMLEYITSKDDKYQVNENKLVVNREIACSKTTREGNTRADTTDYICDELPDNYKLKPVMNLYDIGIKKYNRRTGVVVDPSGSSSTLLARTQGDNNMVIENENVVATYDEYNHKINGNETIGTIQAMYPTPNHGHRLLVKNATKQGYLEAEEGDGINLSSRMEYQRGNVQKQMIQTIDTMGGESKGVVVRTIGNYSPLNHNASRIVDKEYSAPTVMENHGTVTAIVEKNNKNAKHQQDIIQDSNGNARTLVSGTHGNGGHYTKTIMNDLRIRKLTPKECFRLMGVKDEDFDKCAKNQSDSSLYHLAGDSICTTVLMAIFSQLLNIEWRDKLWNIKNST